jgi:hypothetical protein
MPTALVGEGVASMNINLPEPIAAYFAADKINGEATARCFTKDAVVKDEGRTYRGPESIRQWKDAASAKYQYTCEPFSSAVADGKTVVSCHLTGNFPGSPIDLRYIFQLESGKVASLEIRV